MLNSLKHCIFRQYRKSVTKKHQLNYLFWECTLSCNLNCLHCGSDCLKSSNIPDMPLQDFINVLDDIKANNPVKKLTVCITGGEPLLRKDLEQAGKEIIKRGFNWGIVTNGLLFTPERFYSLINAGITSLSFSLDGFEQEHNYLRQNPNSFSKVIEGIKTIIKFQQQKPGYFNFDVITCVHKQNLSILPQLRDELINLGVQNWRIFSIFPEGRAYTNEQSNKIDLSLSNSEYIQLMEFISQTRNYKSPQGKSIHLNYSCEGYLGKYELKARDFFFFCRGGINVGSVMCDGSISACLSVRSPEFIQGNIYKDKSFMQVWNTRFEKLRNRNWAKQGKCAKCKQWKNCLGNGLHLHKDYTSPVNRCNFELLNL